jgi:hypothetical protein
LASQAIGVATFNISQTGNYNLNATYSGDANLTPLSAALNPSTITVFNSVLPPTTTTLTISPNALTPDQGATATVKVVGGSQIPTGFIEISQGPDVYIPGLGTLDATGSITIPIPPNSIATNGNIQFTAIYEGDSSHAVSVSNTVTVSANVGDYSFTTSQAMLTMTAGASGKTAISVGASGGFRLSCAVSSPVLGCSLAQKSLTLPSDPSQQASTTLTVTSQAGTTASLKEPLRRKGLGAELGGSSAVLTFAVFLMPRKRRKMITTMLASISLIAILAQTTACGTSHIYKQAAGSTPATTPSPNAGTYTVTVTALSAGITKTILLKVVLQ